MQCVILAGGLGTRMRPSTERVPKAMLEVAGHPFVHHQLTLVASQGFTDVTFSIAHLGAAIRDFVGDGSRWGLVVRYVDEGRDLRGTGGALRLALDAGALEQRFVLLYGDSYLPVDVAPVLAAFEADGRPALMTVHRNGGRWDRSNVRFADGTVLRYEKGVTDPTMEYIDYGLAVLDRSIVADRIPSGTVVDLADTYHRLSRSGLLAGFEVAQRFYEVGSPDGLAELDRLLSGGSTPGN